MPANQSTVAQLIHAFESGSQSMDDVVATAEQIAQQLLQMPESERKSTFHQLKTSNEVLHAAVRQQVDRIREQARREGGEQMLEGGM